MTTSLPPGLQKLWGLHARPRRGPRPELSVERIVQAGLEIADAEGLGGLSMSRVAERLGFTTMSLYRHVANKEELLVLIWSAAASQPPPDTRAGGWRDGLRRWYRGQVALFRDHPWLIDIPISGPPITPADVAWMDAGLRALADTGLGEGEKLGVLLAFNGQARYQVKLLRDLAQARRAERPAAASYGQLLRALVDPERFPALWRTVESGELDDEPSEGPEMTDEELEFGVELLLDGVAALIERAGTERAGTERARSEPGAPKA